MILTFTLDDVVRFVYDEMDDDEAHKIRESMLFDDELMDMCQQLMAVKNSLDAHPVLKQPSSKSVSKILEYSSAYEMEEVAEQ